MYPICFSYTLFTKSWTTLRRKLNSQLSLQWDFSVNYLACLFPSRSCYQGLFLLNDWWAEKILSLHLICIFELATSKVCKKKCFHFSAFLYLIKCPLLHPQIVLSIQNLSCFCFNCFVWLIINQYLIHSTLFFSFVWTYFHCFFFSLSIFIPTQQSFSKSSLWFWIRLGFGLGFLEIIFKYSRDLKNESKIIFVGNKFSCFLDSDCRFDCRYFIYTQLHQRDGI